MRAVIDGTCDPAFAAVREAFAANFAEHGELGAAVCVMVDGRVVADLWGGFADIARTTRWQRDTLVNIFSIGKGLTAALCAHLVGEGVLDVDVPVGRWWPEFAAAGKAGVRLRHLLSHAAGLPSVREPLPPDAMYRWDVMAGALAAQQPWWEPGTAHGYHVNTFGFLVGEVMRRATGRTVGQLLAERIAGPLGADVHLGLPEREHHRVAEFAYGMQRPTASSIAWPPDTPDPVIMEANAYSNPPGLSGVGEVNTGRWRAAEMPSTNAHGTARGVARVFAALAAGGTLGRTRVVDAGALAAATSVQVEGDDLILHRPSRFGLGFQLTQPERPMGPNRRAFGHYGGGGSLGMADPDAGVALGYVMNGFGPRWQNPRNRGLINAVYASLGA